MSRGVEAKIRIIGYRVFILNQLIALWKVVLESNTASTPECDSEMK